MNILPKNAYISLLKSFYLSWVVFLKKLIFTFNHSTDERAPILVTKSRDACASKKLKSIGKLTPDPQQELHLENVEMSGRSTKHFLRSSRSWEGMSPMVSPSSCLACHQLGSVELTTWRISPYLKGRPISVHGNRVSFTGS